MRIFKIYDNNKEEIQINENDLSAYKEDISGYSMEKILFGKVFNM